MSHANNSKLTRRELLKGGIALGATLGVPMINTQAHADSGRPPNIVFLFADQMRADVVGCMGNPQVRTPNMDRLASQGVLFNNAISGYPVCTPYRAMCLTGRYGHSTGVVTNDVALPNSETSIAEVLRRQGYRTGYIGKWHLEWHRRPFVPKDRRQGFEYWAVRNCAHDYFDSFVCMDTPEHVPLPGYEPDAQTDLAIDYIRRQGKDPFCLFVSWGTPHNPYVAPDKYTSLYDPSDIRQRPNVNGDYRKQLAAYYAMTTNLDDNLGRLMKTLDEQGIADDTILVFTSDHGDMLGSQGQELKQRPWEESIHVPFFLRYPRKVSPGRTLDVLTNSVDIMPTLLSLADVDVPGGVQGEDLSNHALGKPGPRPKSVLLQNILPCDHAVQTNIGAWRGVRTSRYTYARGIEDGWVLYDNALDPFQMNNLIGKPEAAEVQESLEKELQRMLDLTGDDFATAEVWKDRVMARRPEWNAGPGEHRLLLP